MTADVKAALDDASAADVNAGDELAGARRLRERVHVLARHVRDLAADLTAERAESARLRAEVDRYQASEARAESLFRESIL